MDWMAISSYGSGTKSSGVVRIIKDLDTDITGRHVLIVEDIIDSGLTLSWLRRQPRVPGPASVEICTLLRKPEAAKVDIDVRYVGFDIPNEFVVGYGLDYAEKYRNLRVSAPSPRRLLLETAAMVRYWRTLAGNAERPGTRFNWWTAPRVPSLYEPAHRGRKSFACHAVHESRTPLFGARGSRSSSSLSW